MTSIPTNVSRITDKYGFNPAALNELIQREEKVRDQMITTNTYLLAVTFTRDGLSKTLYHSVEGISRSQALDNEDQDWADLLEIERAPDGEQVGGKLSVEVRVCGG